MAFQKQRNGATTRRKAFGWLNGVFKIGSLQSGRGFLIGYGQNQPNSAQPKQDTREAPTET